MMKLKKSELEKTTDRIKHLQKGVEGYQFDGGGGGGGVEEKQE